MGTNFWGKNPENNFGFGNSNISDSIANIQKQNSDLFPKPITNDDMSYKLAQNGLNNGVSNSNSYPNNNINMLLNKTLENDDGYINRPEQSLEENEQKSLESELLDRMF